MDFLLSNLEKIKSFKIQKKKYSADFKTKFDTLKIIESDVLKTETKKGIVFFYYPKEKDFSNDEIQKALKEAHLKAIKIEAKNYLPDRLLYLSRKHGFVFGKISLRNQ